MIAMSSTAEVSWYELRAHLQRFVAARVPAADVDDVVQDALAKVHTGLAGVRDQDRLAPWIYQVTRNAIADHHRRRKPSEPLADEPPASPPEHESVEAGMLGRCLTGFVAMLPPVYRQAITLVELEGLSQVQAAERLGVSVSTMKSRVQRGRAQLRALVETCCAIDLDARGGVIDVTPRGGKCVAC